MLAVVTDRRHFIKYSRGSAHYRPPIALTRRRPNLYNARAVNKAKGSGLALIGVGTILTSMMLAGLLLGYGLDKWLNTLPLFMFSLGCLGFVGGLLKVYKLLSVPPK